MHNYMVYNSGSGTSLLFEKGSEAFREFEGKVRAGCIYRRRRVPKTPMRSARVEWLCIDEKGI
jgi:hypothetical protein